MFQVTYPFGKSYQEELRRVARVSGEQENEIRVNTRITGKGHLRRIMEHLSQRIFDGLESQDSKVQIETRSYMPIMFIVNSK
jgi:hypothetical protein